MVLSCLEVVRNTRYNYKISERKKKTYLIDFLILTKLALFLFILYTSHASLSVKIISLQSISLQIISVTKTKNCACIILQIFNPIGAILITNNENSNKDQSEFSKSSLIFACIIFTISAAFYWFGEKRINGFYMDFSKIAEELSYTTIKVLHSFCEMGSIPNYVYENKVTFNAIERENLLLPYPKSSGNEREKLLPVDLIPKTFKVSDSKIRLSRFHLEKLLKKSRYTKDSHLTLRFKKRGTEIKKKEVREDFEEMQQMVIEKVESSEDGIELDELWTDLVALVSAPPFTLHVENLTCEKTELSNLIDQKFHLTLTTSKNIYKDETIFISLKLEDEKIDESKSIVSSRVANY